MKKEKRVRIGLNKKILNNIEVKNKNPKKQKVVHVEDNNEKNLSKGISILNNHKNKIKASREERIERFQEEHEEVDTEKKIKYYKIRPVILSVMIIIIILLVYLFFRFGPIFGISLNKDKGITNEKKINFVATDEDVYTTYNQEMLIYSNQQISTYNGNGRLTWEYKIADMFTPNIYTHGKYMLISNNSNGTVYLFESKREILNKKIDGSIQNVYIDDNGNIAIEYSTSGYKKIIGVYTKNGKLKYNAYLQAGAIIDIKMINDANNLVVAQADASSFKIGVNISLVDGKKTSDNIKQIVKLDNNFIYDLTIQGQNLIILLDSKIIKCNIDTGVITDIKSFDINQMIYISVGDNYYTYIDKVNNGQKDKYKINMVRFDNTIIGTTEVDNSPKIMQNSGYLNYYIYQDKLQVINKWGVEIKNVTIDIPPKEVVVFDNERSIGLIYTNKVYIVNM